MDLENSRYVIIMDGHVHPYAWTNTLKEAKAIADDLASNFGVKGVNCYVQKTEEYLKPPLIEYYAKACKEAKKE